MSNLSVTTNIRQAELPRYEPLPVFEATFRSRNATFCVKTDDRSPSYALSDSFAVAFFCGPVGIHLNPDEAETLGQQFIFAANHYRQAISAAKESSQ